VSDREGTPYSYSESEKLGKRIAALIRNGFEPKDAADLALLEMGLKPGPRILRRRPDEDAGGSKRC
jgi:hypothetical protein